MSLVKSHKNEEAFPSLLSDFFGNDNFLSNRWFEKEFNQSLPPVNIKEDGKQFDIEFAAPGFGKNDFKIDLDGNVLTISAEKKEEKQDDHKRFTRKEFMYTTFSRSFTLPQTVSGDKIDASYNHGILTLNIPKKEESKSGQKKQIIVK
ncbi:hypothetical protein CNR22_18645 [Sphingobacteriaceae bacterium]|nr:hypothetical protein CNR22_18645 [Sphingobacteriaceae bacterium]